MRGLETAKWRRRVSVSLQVSVSGLEEGGGQTGPHLPRPPRQHLRPPGQAVPPPGGRRSGPQEVSADLPEVLSRAGDRPPWSPALHRQRQGDTRPHCPRPVRPGDQHSEALQGGPAADRSGNLDLSSYYLLLL